MKKLKILISNDDGITSPGIHELSNAMKEIGDVTVIAPATEQSAVGHKITMKIPLRISKFYKGEEFFGYAIDGTPADCIKIGIRNILKERPDIVISGINNGSNTAVNIVYSGTVSAAREASIMDVPSIAISVTNHAAQNFTYAGKVAQKLVKLVADNDLPLGTLLNVNVPDLPEEKIKGIKLTRQGRSKWDDIYEERTDPYGAKYYWLTGDLMKLDNDDEFDQFAIQNDFVSITPIHFDLTDFETYNAMKNWKLSDI
ncbi:MAG: 5'/3'-nucleotidase SurE [Melioribacteraceae bacterium]|nr:5'/3'-nucleotidase SurE [Melioribacteraceae bacterium]MCF8266275.1 5'/3'-nucleotidase SurE [Melioribacteraceae bacterium]MCF8431938.1 5'/3'-nucleotidase SurE [Melioribacteraceae bacterium]